MIKLLGKELRLTASPLSFWFIAFGLMALIPGYPITVGAFFVCMGIFQSFQSAREANDILYTAMLPVEKADVIRAKFVFTVFIQLAALLIMLVLTVIRMNLLSSAAAYTANAMMNANWAFIGYVLMVYAAFNFIFLRGFFKTAYKFGRPFIIFSIATFVIVSVGEALHFFPGLKALNSTVFESIQLIPLFTGIAAYIGFTAVSLSKSIKSFEIIDL